MSGHVYRRLFTGKKNCRYRSVAGILAGVVLLSTVLLYFDFRESKKDAEFIRRNSYGEGSRTEEREVIVDGKQLEDPIEITVGEQRYTDEEITEVFALTVRKLDLLILGENKSLDEVRKDLNLITKIPEEPIRIVWETDRYDVINMQGELNEEQIDREVQENTSLREEGILVQLRAFLRYTEEEEREALYEVTVKVFPPLLDEGKENAETVLAAIQQKEEADNTKEILKFPDRIRGKSVLYRKPMDYRGVAILFLGIVCLLLLACMGRQKEKEEIKRRKEQMMRDYPEVVGSLRLLLGAGMTVKNAWKKIVTDYEKKKAKSGERYAYEEMLKTYYEMQSGVTEAESYERFGRRCGLTSYLKLGALLSQNLRKGTGGLSEMLQMEAIHAFEERKASAKRQGEEAGTKLLLPMFFMLGIVLVIVIVPAFLSIQI